MGIFDDVVLNAKTAASAVGKKAEQIVDLSKLKYAAAGLNNEISKKKEELGHYIYESSKIEKLEHNRVTAMIAEIKDLEENLLATKEMIAEAKNKKNCKECGYENDKEAAFCNNCGSKLEQIKTKSADDDITVAVAKSVEDAEEVVQEKVEEVKEKVVDFKQKAVDKTEQAIDKTEQAVEKAADKVKDKTEDLAEKAKDKLEEIKKD